MTGRFEVYEDKAGRHRFRLKASNGQIVAVGDAYETKAAGKKGCQSVQRAADGAVIEEVNVDPSTSQITPADDVTPSTPTRWLVYKHPEEKPLVVVADGWSRTSDGALLRFVNHPPADGGSERVVAAFNAGSVFGFVRDTDESRPTNGDDRLLAFPGKDDAEEEAIAKSIVSLLRHVRPVEGRR